MACEMLGTDTELSPDSEFRSSEQIWTSPIVEANPFLPNTCLQAHTSWLPLLPQGRLHLPTSVNFTSQLMDQPLIVSIFSRAVSPGLGPR